MAEEVELKLALATADQARFLRHPLLKQALERHVATLDNIYYDTTDFALRRRCIALRLRRKGRQWLQTVKLAGSSAGGLSSRPEWEGPYGGHFDFSAVDVPAVREWLSDPALLASIVPTCETRFRRITWRFAAAPGAVLLTLDRGAISAQGRHEPISEVELELTGDAPVQAIFELAAQLAARVALTPAAWSKAERGFRLASGLPTLPCKATTAPLSAELSPFAAFRCIALSCLEHLQQNHPGALQGDDPEYIHQMRVATRRLRAALRLFAPVLPAAFSPTLRAPLQALMQQLGQVRDLDVLLAEIAQPVRDAFPDDPGLTVLVDAITRRRATARAQAGALLAAPSYGRLLLSALEALYAPPPAAPTPPPALPAFAAARLQRLRRKLQALGAAAAGADPVALHALRIGVKRQRYALEFFSSLASRGDVPALLKRLAALQDTLGQCNDLSNAGALLSECAGDEPLLRQAAMRIVAWHGPRAAHLQADLARELPRLTHLRLPQLGAGA